MKDRIVKDIELPSVSGEFEPDGHGVIQVFDHDSRLVETIDVTRTLPRGSFIHICPRHIWQINRE